LRNPAELPYIGRVPGRNPSSAGSSEEMTMAWTTPTLVEICIGLEINGYLPAEI
jgi:coenzyme PQQ precursor peptide PqqA